MDTRQDTPSAVDAATAAGLRAQLRALPEREPPADLLAGIEARLDAMPAPTVVRLTPRARLQRWSVGIAAAAAAVVMAVGLGLPNLQGGNPGALPGAEPPTAASGMPSARIATMQARSQALEQQYFAHHQAQPAVAQVDQGEQIPTSARVLKARLADVDQQLSALLLSGNAGPEAEELWQQRVALMQSLVDVQQPSERVYMF